MECPRCKGLDVVKNGKSRSGKQRYFCVPCQKTFQTEPPANLVKTTLAVEEMRQLRADGLNNAAIAKLAGITRERVRQLLQGHNRTKDSSQP